MIMGSIKQESRFQPAVCEEALLRPGKDAHAVALVLFSLRLVIVVGLGNYAARTGQPLSVSYST